MTSDHSLSRQEVPSLSPSLPDPVPMGVRSGSFSRQSLGLLGYWMCQFVSSQTLRQRCSGNSSLGHDSGKHHQGRKAAVWSVAQTGNHWRDWSICSQDLRNPSRVRVDLYPRPVILRNSQGLSNLSTFCTFWKTTYCKSPLPHGTW